MKKNIIAISFVVVGWMFLMSTAQAIDWITANQATLSWQPVTTLSNGDTIPDSDIIKYDVFIVDENGNKTSDRVQAGDTTDTNFVVTLKDEGNFILGVRAIRLIAGIPRGMTEIIWTDDTTVMRNGKAQGVTFFHPTSNLSDLEILFNGN